MLLDVDPGLSRPWQWGRGEREMYSFFLPGLLLFLTMSQLLLSALGPGLPLLPAGAWAWYTHRQPPRQQQWVADGRVGGGRRDQDANRKQGLFSSRPGQAAGGGGE